MNVVFISPNFPPQFHLFCRALKAEGARVLGIGDSPAETLSAELRSQLDDYYHVPDMRRHDEMLRAVGYFTWKWGRIDRIDSLNEFWLEVEARLREDFNIYGLRPRETRELRSKSGMKPYFEKAGVKFPAAERFSTPDRLRAFAKKQGYPLVLKPDVGVGAAHTWKVEDGKDLERALESDLSGYLVEEFVRGVVTTFDGIADKDGRILFASSLVYSEGVMDVVNRRSDMAYWTQREIPADLEEIGRRTVQAFGIRERFFHIEYFRLPDDSFRALEVNLRPPGGFTTDMMNWASNADVYRLWAQVITGKDVQPVPNERPYSVWHLSRRDGKRYRHSHDEVMAHVQDLLVCHLRIPDALSGAMGNDAYYVRGEDMKRLEQAWDYVRETA